MSILVAQITDTHLFADPTQTSKDIMTWYSLQGVLEALGQMPQQPDLLLLTGDLSQDETFESYLQLQKAVAPLQLPTYWIPGNHDQQLDYLEQALSEPPFSTEKRIQMGQWIILLLDSSVKGAVQGYLTPATLEWLEQNLSTVETPFVLVALHHPPLNVGSAWMDSIGLDNKAEFQALLQRYGQVKAVLFGHVHQELDRDHDGIRYMAAPSTCVQFTPDSDEFAIDSNRAPGFRLLTLHDDGRIDTCVERVPYVAPIETVDAASR